ncbi:MAG: BatD family protein [Campylobacterales bacterium]|nr:BatD family protein [Campylobacterales bacterium]
MKNLGKIFFILLFVQLTLFASVKATLEPRVVYKGESAIFKLTMSGNDIIKPALSDICGNDIISTGSQTSIESINGSYARTYTLSYEFTPFKSCEIAPVEVQIDGKQELSNAIKVIVKEPAQDKSAPFVLSLKTSKPTVYVGEPFELELTLTQSLRAQAADSKFIAPDFNGFWLKSQTQPKRVEGDENIVTTFTYTLAAQREGNLSIEPAQLKIATRVSGVNGWGTFAPQVKWRTYYSNTPTLKVEPIPNGASLIGNFTISTELTKKEINPNEALNVNVVVKGIGNLEDIKSFKPYIANVNVFDEKMAISGNKLTQKLAFVSDSNFTIPSFELVFFNTKTQKVQKIVTEPIPINVKGSGVKKELKIEREQVNTPAPLKEESSTLSTNDPLWLIVVYFIGLVSGIILMLLKSISFSKKQNVVNIKDEKLLFMKLLPFQEDKDVKNIMNILEKNSYSTQKESLDKKLLKEVLSRYNIS